MLLARLALPVTLAEHAAHALNVRAPVFATEPVASAFSAITGEEGKDVHSSHEALTK